jgi:gliding motility-associated-like protein
MKKQLLYFHSIAWGAILLFSNGGAYTQATTVTFNYTGAAQTWTVPLCVTSIQVDVRGADGGGGTGGNGAKVTHNNIPVTPGQVLQINVGGSGTLSAGGWNGGGLGYAGNGSSGGGGGASDIRTTPYALANRIIVAGGGGGMGGGSPTVGAGGAGGCATGVAGTPSPYQTSGGTGGTQVAGGLGGPPWAGGGLWGQNGALGIGGNGGFWNTASGGGGGGGYYGGGGGGSDGCCTGANGGAGGGGGSSFTPAGGVCTQNSNNGPGLVTITYTPGLPPITANNTGPYCEGTNISLTASNGATNYNWTGPNAYNQLSTQNPIITGTTAIMSGVYTVVATGTPGCTASATTTVVVNPNPVPTATNTGPYCAGDLVELSSPAGYPTDDWAGPAGYVQADMQNPTLASAATSMNGVYTVTVTTAAGCLGTATTSVTVYDLPIAVAANTGPYCEGYLVDLTSGGGADYDWTGPGGFILNNTQNTSFPSAMMAMNGTYTVTVTDTNGCVSTATTTMVVNALPVPTANNTGPYCEGAPINLSSSGGAGYGWAGPGAFISLVQNPVINPSTVAMTGTYTVVATSAAGCTASTTTNVVVTALPIPTATNTGPYCEGQTVELRANGGSTYSWSGPLSYGSLLQNPDINGSVPGNTGTYTVIATDGAGCTGSATTDVIVYAHPEAVPYFNPQNPTTLYPEVDFYNNSYANIVDYFWNIGGVTYNTTSFTHEFLEPGTYDSYLLVTSQWGCTDTTHFKITVEAETSVYIPNSFTPNGDNLNEIFYAYGENWKSMEMIIFDRWGKEVFYSADPAKGWDGTLSNMGTQLMQGTYTYKILIVDSYGKSQTYMGFVNLLR